MRIQEYNQYPFSITVTLATPRPDGAPSTVIVAAKKHEEYISQVRGVLREFKHIDPTTSQVPAALRLETYFPTSTYGGQTIPLYAVRVLTPGGSLRSVDVEFWQDVSRIRYTGLLVLLPSFISAGERVSFAFERHLEFAMRGLFQAQSLPVNFIPGDDPDRPDDRTVIDIVAEIGAVDAAPGGYEVPTPTG